MKHEAVLLMSKIFINIIIFNEIIENLELKENSVKTWTAELLYEWASTIWL